MREKIRNIKYEEKRFHCCGVICGGKKFSVKFGFGYKRKRLLCRLDMKYTYNYSKLNLVDFVIITAL